MNIFNLRTSKLQAHKSSGSQPDWIQCYNMEISMAAMKIESVFEIYLQMDPEFLTSRIGFLVWRYQLTRSKRMACSIVRHIEALCLHPELDGSALSRCGYQRSLRHWRMLAGGNQIVQEV
ncbi:MAG: hypothetical protein G8D61_15020 [gamma proteobacterium symbiont of Ctena orbiculata]